MKKWVPACLVLLCLGLLAIGAAIAAVSFFGGDYLRDRLIAKIKADCPECTAQIEKLAIHPWSTEITAEGLEFRNNPHSAATVWARAARAEIHFSLQELLNRRISVTSATISHPAVEVDEYEDRRADPTPPGEKKEFAENLPPLSLFRGEVKNGKFEYRHILGKEGSPAERRAEIRIWDASGTLTNFASRPGLLPESRSVIAASCRMGTTGRSHLHADFDLLARRNDDHIEIELKDQKMEETNSFLFPEAGITTEGFLEHAFATVEIREGRGEGVLMANYQNLKLRFRDVPERSPLKTVVNGILNKLTVAPTRPKNADDRPEAHFRMSRQNDQSIINFLLSGLKPAAKKILGG